ncbi:MAG: helix-turn-helix transcriptional regulator [Gammaproteobacteria bacterium]
MQHLHQATMGSVRSRRTIGNFNITVSDYAAGMRLPAHEHTSAYLCLVARGGYVQFAGNQTNECPQGLLLVHPDGHCHANRFSASGARCINMHVDHALDDNPAIRRLLGDHRCLRLPDVALLLRRIERELVANDAAAELALQAAVLDVIAQACRHFEGRPRREPEWLARVRERLHDDPYATPSLQELADQAGVHSTHLARSFHRVYGMSVGEYLRRLRIEHARDALAGTRQPIATIAADAGFADQSHFTRVFRRTTGETPRAFRQRMQNRD